MCPLLELGKKLGKNLGKLVNRQACHKHSVSGLFFWFSILNTATPLYHSEFPANSMCSLTPAAANVTSQLPLTHTLTVWRRHLSFSLQKQKSGLELAVEEERYDDAGALQESSDALASEVQRLASVWHLAAEPPPPQRTPRESQQHEQSIPGRRLSSSHHVVEQHKHDPVVSRQASTLAPGEQSGGRPSSGRVSLSASGTMDGMGRTRTSASGGTEVMEMAAPSASGMSDGAEMMLPGALLGLSHPQESLRSPDPPLDITYAPAAFNLHGSAGNEASSGRIVQLHDAKRQDQHGASVEAVSCDSPRQLLPPLGASRTRLEVNYSFAAAASRNEGSEPGCPQVPLAQHTLTKSVLASEILEEQVDGVLDNGSATRERDYGVYTVNGGSSSAVMGVHQGSHSSHVGSADPRAHVGSIRLSKEQVGVSNHLESVTANVQRNRETRGSSSGIFTMEHAGNIAHNVAVEDSGDSLFAGCSVFEETSS